MYIFYLYSVLGVQYVNIYLIWIIVYHLYRTARLSLRRKKQLHVILILYNIYFHILSTVSTVGHLMTLLTHENQVMRVFQHHEYLCPMIYESDVNCSNNLRMDRKVFLKLCDILRNKRQIKPTKNTNIEEIQLQCS